jgi:hypothetical protein
MRARILLLAVAVAFCACRKPQVSAEQSSIDSRASNLHPALEGTVYLLRRIAVATEESLQGFDEGSSALIIEDRSGKLLVQVEGMQFEVNREDVTSDAEQGKALLARAAEREAAHVAATQRAEDRRFLAEEDAQRRSFAEAKIAQLRSAIEAARAEIARLRVDAYESTIAWEGQPIWTAIDDMGSYFEDSAPLAEENELQERIAALRTYIVKCDREIQVLSDTLTTAN